MIQIQTLVLGDYETNCYLVWAEGAQECVVIDPGYEPARILEEAKALGKTIIAILLTHGHFDHVGGVRQLFAETDCDIYLCPEDCALPERFTAGSLCYTNSVAEGDILQLAGLTFSVLHTPGHTPGCVCYACEDCLFSGDTLFAGSCGRTDFPLGDWTALKKSLERLKNLPVNYKVYPGHGSATTLEAEKKYNPYL